MAKVIKESAEKERKSLTYKGYPLIRKGSTIYYGNMSDKYIIQCQITDSEKKGDLDIAKKVQVTLQETNPNIKAKDRIVKKSEKAGLYSAMDLASVWLERALSAK